MAEKVLIAYATRNGSTAEIAEAVGKELKSAGHSVEVKEIKTGTSVEGNTSIVIGAPMYAAKYIEAKKFVDRFRENIVGLPVAMFAVGLAAVSKDPRLIDETKNALQGSLDPIKKVSMFFFSGNLNGKKISFITRKMVEHFGKVPAGDYRDWDAIAAWGKEVAGKVGS